VSFTQDEGARFVHRVAIDALVERAMALRTLGELGPLFDASGVTWSIYRTLSGALAHEPRLFADNAIFSAVTHPGGDTYPTPGAAARLTGEERDTALPAPRLGQDSDAVLSSLLGMGDGEIARLHDAGIVA
jgi:2-methylfumaryl-CoA isomerase